MILVPVDFSPISVLALRYAVMVANHLRQPIKLFHAIPVHSVWMEEEDLEFEKEAEHGLHQLADQIVHEGFSPENVSTLMVHRFPLNSVIEDLVEKEDVKYIVMGTSGASGLKEHLLGSFTSGVIETSKVPVIAVPENTKLVPFKSVVYATDLTHLETECKILVDFIHSFNARLNILNILPTAVPEKGDPELEHKLRHTCNYPDIHIHYRSHDDLQEGIKAFLVEEQADLLAMFTRKKNFFVDLFCQGQTEAMVCHLPVPLFALKSH